MKGSFTVEAAFVVSICVWVLVAICYGGVYAHDNIIIETETNTVASRLIREEKENLESVVKKSLQQNCFLFDIKKIKVSGFLNEKTIQVSYDIPVSFSLLKKIWQGNSSVLTYETKREMITPALLKWDFEKEEESGKEFGVGKK